MMAGMDHCRETERRRIKKGSSIISVSSRSGSRGWLVDALPLPHIKSRTIMILVE